MNIYTIKFLIKASFEQNPDALNNLLATGNAELTHTQDKTKWGTEFPKLLMEVRNELRGTQPQAPANNVEGLVTELNSTKTGLISKSVSSQPVIESKTAEETKEEAPWFTWNDLSLAQRKKLSSKTNQEEFDSWSKDKQDKFVACNG
jgi:hypothetical protein